MYETLMQTLRTFAGVGVLRVTLAVAAGVTALGLIAAATPAFRGGIARWREGGGWRAGVAGCGIGVFKLLVLFLFVRLAVVAMVFQSGLFAQHHGRVTERNRSAVEMKWGVPHEQRELAVAHTEKKTWVTRQLKLPGEKGEVRQEGYWSDQEKPVQAVAGQMPQIISVTSEERDAAVPQKSIVSADVEIRVKSNPRTLGNANYAGYEDVWKFSYAIANAYNKPTTAHLTFPLPAPRGVFNRVVARVDGKDMPPPPESGDDDEGTPALRWTLPMTPGQQSTVELSYESRGLEHLRYIPKRMTQTGHYRVALQVEGVPPDQLDFPIGSMPPEEKLTEIRGSPYTLHWNLDNALTSYDIGVKLPQPPQPNYHFAMLLEEAPVGLAFLLLLLVLPRLLVGEPVSLGVASLLGVAYYLLYTFMATLADLLTGFAAPFGIAAAVVVALVARFRLRDPQSRFLAWQDTAAFAVLAVLYPLAVVDAERTGLWMQIGALAILAYVATLVAAAWRRRKGERPASG